MEVEDQQDAAVRTGGQSDGYNWEFNSDGRFNATKTWRLIQNARARNETAEEAEDPRTDSLSVARDMVTIQESGGKSAHESALRAAQAVSELHMRLQ